MKWTASDGSARHVDRLGRTMDGPPGHEEVALDLRHPGPVDLAGHGALHDALTGLTGSGSGPGVRIVALDAWDTQRVLGANQASVDDRVPLLVAGAFEPGRLHVGPFIVPGETACYQCYLGRRLQNTLDRPGLEGLMAGPSLPLDADLLQAAAAMVRHEVRRFQAGLPCASTGTVLVLETPGLRLLHDPVLRVPRCTACGRHRDHPPTAPGTRLA